MIPVTTSIPLNAALVLLLAADPDPMALAQEARAAYQSGDYLRAEARYRELATAFPAFSSAPIGLAESLARLGRTEEAIAELTKAADAGVGADIDAIRASFAGQGERPELLALFSRFRGNVTAYPRGAVAFTLAEKDLLPESVAYDASDRTFYVGSLHKRKIVAVQGGAVRDFVPAKAGGLGAVLGMKVDPQRRELWANSCHGDFPPAIVDREPARIGEAAVHRYDLRSGKLVKAYRTGSRSSPICFNDLVIVPGGDVYLSSGDRGVYRVDRAGDRLERFAEVPGLMVNGIAASPDGRRLFLADFARGVVVLDVASRAFRPLAVPPGTTLAGIDGLYEHDGSLVGIQNGLAAGPERVVQAFLDPVRERVTCVELLERNHPAYDVPTTGVVVGNDLYYVAGSQLNRLDGEGRPLPVEKLRESAILRLPLRRGCEAGWPSATVDLEAERRSLLAAHESDRLAHFAADAARIAASAPEEFLSVSRGRIERIPREAERAFFEGYFKGARYEAWDDLEPPVVRVSDDGSMGWIVSRLRVKRTSPEADGRSRETAFVYAGMMTYEKRDGRWARVANVSTFE